MHLTPPETDSAKSTVDFTDFELELVFTTIKKCCGQDFNGYSLRSIRRLIEGIMHDENLIHVSQLIPKILYQIDFQEKIVDRLTVSYSKLFRDPKLFIKLKHDVFPMFSSYPRVSIWVAGCATGEEAYSLAILLDEVGLLDKTLIYATDISVRALKSASSGKLKFALSEQDEQRYKESGGKKSLSHYFSSESDSVFDQRLLSRIVFERHDLTVQSCFISAQLVLCRNVFIYFDSELQDKVLSQLLNSISNRGYLAVGLEENIGFCPSVSALELLSRKAGLYRKRSTQIINDLL